jgi:hypothetical protein
VEGHPVDLSTNLLTSLVDKSILIRTRIQRRSAHFGFVRIRLRDYGSEKDSRNGRAIHIQLRAPPHLRFVTVRLNACRCSGVVQFSRQIERDRRASSE